MFVVWVDDVGDRLGCLIRPKVDEGSWDLLHPDAVESPVQAAHTLLPDHLPRQRQRGPENRAQMSSGVKQ